MITERDHHWMRRALELAERGRGHVEPNPMVGAVVVRDDRIVGEGWHQQYGGPHAEVHALTAAGAAARGATLYVTLEPCCHHGKTPPCTDAILAAGIGRVVGTLLDPFPQVSGKGREQLRRAGIEFDIGVEGLAAYRLNAPYIKLVTAGRPWVIAKWAMSLDGKIATASGDSKWISGEGSRRRVHELRGRVDAILVGIGTVLADDPLLTARPPGPRTATRIVLDSQGRLSPESQLVRTAGEAPLLVVTTEAATSFSAPGVDWLRLPAEQGRPALAALLDELGRRRVTHLLVEGGAEVLGSFRDAGAIDEAYVFIAPKLLGGAAAKSPVGGRGVATLAKSLAFGRWEMERIDDDLLVHGWVGDAAERDDRA
jgi:diaminohydroxyphosphoribosylaminopyrimidine deaminase/5-amino-6-(5-phosphoribosylamino)uracil reductase